MYADGTHSLAGVKEFVRRESGRKFYKSAVERILKNPFYSGFLQWEGRLYPGKHDPIISEGLFRRVQAVFQGHNRPKYGRQRFAYSGLLRCAYDGCAVTAERAKLLRIVLSNCTIDSASLYPTYRKPFNLIFRAAQAKEWWTLVDDFRTLQMNELMSDMRLIDSVPLG